MPRLARRCPAWPIALSGKLNRKILTRSFMFVPRAAGRPFREGKNKTAGACGAGRSKSADADDQLRTVMQEISARFSVLQAASA